MYRSAPFYTLLGSLSLYFRFIVSDIDRLIRANDETMRKARGAGVKLWRKQQQIWKPGRGKDCERHVFASKLKSYYFASTVYLEKNQQMFVFISLTPSLRCSLASIFPPAISAFFSYLFDSFSNTNALVPLLHALSGISQLIFIPDSEISPHGGWASEVNAWGL